MGERGQKLVAGIYIDRKGFRAFQRVSQGAGGLRSKRFDSLATIREMREWQESTRVEARKAKAEGKTPTIARGTLAADVQTYLRLVRTMPSYTDRVRDLQAWVDVLGMRPRAKLTRDDYRLVLQDWRLEGKHGKPLAASTVNHRRTALLHLYSTLDGRGSPCPLREIKPFQEPPPEPRDLGLQTVLAIFAHLRPSKSRARLKVLAWTGIRGSSELGKMKAEHVDLEHGRCWVPTGKKGRPRTLILSAPAALAWQEFAALEAWGSYSGQSLRKSFLLAVAKLNDARAKAEPPLPPLAGLRVYDLRHTIATALRRSGADLADVQAYLGHASQKMTMRYAPYSSEKLRRALETIG